MFMQPPTPPEPAPEPALEPAPEPAPRPDAAERTERHLRTVAELTHGAAQLAQDALATALRRSAAAAAAEAAGLPPPSFPRPAAGDAIDTFCRLFDRVCRGVVLEARLAGQWKDAGRERRRARRIEPRRTRLRRILHEAVVVYPDDPERDGVGQKIEDALADDKIQDLMADGALLGDVVITICQGFDLLVDADRLPDDALHTTRTYPFFYRSSEAAPAVTQQGPDPP
jgi:hypothetical protein